MKSQDTRNSWVTPTKRLDRLTQSGLCSEITQTLATIRARKSVSDKSTTYFGTSRFHASPLMWMQVYHQTPRIVVLCLRLYTDDMFVPPRWANPGHHEIVLRFWTVRRPYTLSLWFGCLEIFVNGWGDRKRAETEPGRAEWNDGRVWTGLRMKGI